MIWKPFLSIGLWTAAVWIPATPARALINPNYTVVDLVRDSGQVFVLRMSAPQSGRVEAAIVEALVGNMPAERKLSFDFNDAEELTEDDVASAFGGAPTARAVMCVMKDKQDGAVLGALEIGTRWMGLVQGKTTSSWMLDRDPNDLETVWGASARQLIPAIRYTLNDLRPDFPVASTLAWGSDLSLGKLDGPAHGCLATNIGVVLLSDGGDRVYRPGTEGEPPEDVTRELGLASKSRAMAAGDFNGDGRLDLASWDGGRLRLCAQNSDGRFDAPCAECELEECRSLATLGRWLVAGGSSGVTLLTPDGAGGFTARQVSSDSESLGPGGVCAVADFNDDGAPDVVQLFARGLAFHAGSRESGVFAAPVVTRMEIAKHPTVAVCGDYDTDGRLDLIVGGIGGSTLLCRAEDGSWLNVIAETGELGAASGLGQADDVVVTACPSDVNGDGRQSAALFHGSSGPGLFFNRGFACFGVARSLDFSQSDLPAAQALGVGQTTGVLCDSNGDLAPDLLAVDRQQGVWVVFGESERSRRFQAVASLADPAGGPLGVTALMSQRRLGIWVIRPGEPTTINLPRPGPLKLQWKQADGNAVSRDVIVTRPTPVAL